MIYCCSDPTDRLFCTYFARKKKNGSDVINHRATCKRYSDGRA